MPQTIVTLHAVPARRSLRQRVSFAWRWLAVAIDAAATRRQLAGMTEHELSDIGISRAQAQFEAERPLWDLTVTRR